MKCTNCQLITSDKKDLCPRCKTDLRPRKKQLGLPISHPTKTVEELLAVLEGKTNEQFFLAATNKELTEQETKQEFLKPPPLNLTAVAPLAAETLPAELDLNALSSLLSSLTEEPEKQEQEESEENLLELSSLISELESKSAETEIIETDEPLFPQQAVTEATSPEMELSTLLSDFSPEFVSEAELAPSLSTEAGLSMSNVAEATFKPELFEMSSLIEEIAENDILTEEEPESPESGLEIELATENDTLSGEDEDNDEAELLNFLDELIAEAEQSVIPESEMIQEVFPATLGDVQAELAAENAESSESEQDLLEEDYNEDLDRLLDEIIGDTEISLIKTPQSKAVQPLPESKEDFEFTFEFSAEELEPEVAEQTPPRRISEKAAPSDPLLAELMQNYAALEANTSKRSIVEEQVMLPPEMLTPEPTPLTNDKQEYLRDLLARLSTVATELKIEVAQALATAYGLSPEELLNEPSATEPLNKADTEEEFAALSKELDSELELLAKEGLSWFSEETPTKISEPGPSALTSSPQNETAEQSSEAQILEDASPEPQILSEEQTPWGNWQELAKELEELPEEAISDTLGAEQFVQLEQNERMNILFESVAQEIENPELAEVRARNSEETAEQKNLAKNLESEKLIEALERFEIEEAAHTARQFLIQQGVDLSPAQTWPQASLSQKLFAASIDVLSIALLSFLISYFWFYSADFKEQLWNWDFSERATLLAELSLSAEIFLFSWILTQTISVAGSGQSWGGKLLGLGVRTTEGKLPNPGQAALRALAQLTNALTLGVSGIININSKALHDWLSETSVYRIDKSEAEAYTVRTN